MSGRYKALLTIRDYIEYLDCLNEDLSRMIQVRLERYSYSRWAAEELIKTIRNEETTPPIMVVEMFAKKMDQYSTMNQKNSFKFSVAYDAAMDILDAFLIL